MKNVLLLATLVGVAACSKAPSQTSAERAAPVASAGPTSAAHGDPPKNEMVGAAIGKPAPDFTLKDLDGKDVRLSSFKGKTVVLEWFNPGCPFVKASHTKGSLTDAAKRLSSKGVVWLAVNSAAAGKQGNGVEANRAGTKAFAMDHPVLLDESGEVGRAYGATNTPHLFVIDDKGVLVYRGAVDNSPDGEGESPTSGKLERFAEAAIADLAAGRPVATADTKAYGCSVKYAK